MARANREALDAAVVRLRDLRDSGTLVTAHVRLASQGAELSERSMWHHLRDSHDEREEGRSPTDSVTPTGETFAHFRGNVAAAHRACQTAIDGAKGGPGGTRTSASPAHSRSATRSGKGNAVYRPNRSGRSDPMTHMSDRLSPHYKIGARTHSHGHRRWCGQGPVPTLPTDEPPHESRGCEPT